MGFSNQLVELLNEVRSGVSEMRDLGLNAD